MYFRDIYHTLSFNITPKSVNFGYNEDKMPAKGRPQ
jgi:hypothetical protein